MERRVGRKTLWAKRVMKDEQQSEHLTTTEARAGATPHMTRYVLTIGLLLVIVLFAIIFLIAAR